MTDAATLRPASTSDLGQLHVLIGSIERFDSQPFLTSVAEVGEMYDDEMNPAADNLRLLELEGDLVGWARVVHSPSGQKLERAFLEGGIHPDHRRKGLGQRVLEWQTERAADRLAETPSELEAIAIAERYEWQQSKDKLFRAAGYEPARWFDELQRPLADLPPVTEPEGIRVVPWLPEHHEAARLVYNSAFLDHWGTTPRSPQAWASDVIETSGRRIDLSFVAFDGDEMVAYCLNGHYPDDEELTGRRDGWIDSIGTLRSHRGKGIASSLIAHSLAAFADAGLNSSMLGVDSDNPTGAYGIYERMGYVSLQKSLAYIRTIRSGAEPLKMY